MSDNDIEVVLGAGGWPGVFLSGQKAVFTASDLRRVADWLSKDDPYAIPSAQTYLRNLADDLDSCYVKEKP